MRNRVLKVTEIDSHKGNFRKCCILREKNILILDKIVILYIVCTLYYTLCVQCTAVSALPCIQQIQHY